MSTQFVGENIILLLLFIAAQTHRRYTNRAAITHSSSLLQSSSASLNTKELNLNCHSYCALSLYAAVLNMTLYWSGPQESQRVILSDRDTTLNRQLWNAISFWTWYFLWFFQSNLLLRVRQMILRGLNCTIMAFHSYTCGLILEFNYLVLEQINM